MTVAEFIQNLDARWGDKILDKDLRSPKRLFVDIHPKDLLEMARYLLNELKWRFVIASALQSKRGFEIYYHFSVDEIGLIVNVHVVLPVSKPEVESLANITRSANWIEREMHELYGIEFLNHPNMEKLISDGNWDEGVYPYRKE